MENRKVVIGVLGNFHYKKNENLMLLYLPGVKEISKFLNYGFTQI